MHESILARSREDGFENRDNTSLLCNLRHVIADRERGDEREGGVREDCRGRRDLMI